MKNKVYGMFLSTFFLILLYINPVNVYAGVKEDETDIISQIFSDNVLEYSDYYDENGDKGYILVEYYINADNTTNAKKIELKYYYYARVKETAGNKEVGLWLYEWQNNKFDEDITKKVKENDGILSEFYDPSGLIKYPIEDAKYSFSNLFMWPVSSASDYYIKGTSNIKEAVKKHNYKNYSSISKSSNFKLLYLLELNTSPYGRSYLNDNNTYPLKAITTDTTRRNTMLYIEKLTGRTNTYSGLYRKYFNSDGVYWNNTNWNGNVNYIAQTFFEHINYQKYYSKADAIKYSENMVNDKGQSYMFLKYVTEGKTYNVYPRMVWNADTSSLGEGREVSNYTRSSSSQTDGSYNKLTTILDVWENGSINEKWTLGAGLDAGMGNINNLIAKEIGGDISPKYYKNYENINEKMVSTFWSFCRTYEGFYSDIATKVANNSTFKTLNKNDKHSFPTTISAFNKLAKSDFDLFYKYSQQMSIIMAKTFMISGYSCQESAATIYVRTGSSYRSFDSVLLTYDNVYGAKSTLNDTKLRDTNTTSEIQVIDLYDAFKVNTSDRNNFTIGINENYKYLGEDIEFFTTEKGKRYAILLNAGFINKNVGTYLTMSEISAGIVNQEKDKLVPGTPYVVATSISFKTGSNEDISKIKLDRISDYKSLLTKKSSKLQNKLNKIWEKRNFTLFEQQLGSTQSNTEIQFMMIASDVKNYSSSKYKSSILSSLESSSYQKIEGSKNLVTRANLFKELYILDNGNSTLANKLNTIKFNTSELKNRITGLTNTTNNKNGQYFEAVQTGFSTSSKRALVKIINKTNFRNKAITTGEINKYIQVADDLYLFNNKFNSLAKELYGYFQLRDVYYDGAYDGTNSLFYYSTFMIPETAPKLVSGKLYSNDEEEMTYYNSIGKTKKLGAAKAAKETLSVKFIARLATNDWGYYETDLIKTIKDNEDLKLLYTAYKLLANDATALNSTIVRVDAKSAVTYENGILIFTLKDKASYNKFETAIHNLLKEASKTQNDIFGLDLVDNDLDTALGLFNLEQIMSIVIQLILDDTDISNDQAFIIYNVNTPEEDILISNPINKTVKDTRNYIDWDGANTYDISVKFNKNSTENILDAEHKIKKESAAKITNKDYTLTPKREATTIYGEFYLGRIPEASKTGLKLSDYTILGIEKFNQNSYKTEKYSGILSTTNISNLLKKGTTTSILKKYIGKLPSIYTAEYLYSKYLSNTQLSNLTIVPVAYKEMINANMVNGKVVMSSWIDIKDVNMEITPGMIIKYEYQYQIPNNFQDTTWKFISSNNTYNKINQEWYDKHYSIDNLGIDFLLLPTIVIKNGNVIAKNENSISFNTSLYNDFNNFYSNLLTGGNMYISNVTGTSSINKTTIKEVKEKTDEISFTLPINENGKYEEDILIDLDVIYQNLIDSSKYTECDKIEISIENTFYQVPKSGKVYYNNKVKSGDTFNYNNNALLKIPLTTEAINSSTGQYIKIKIHECDTDNSLHNDWEYVIIYFNEANEKDNAISDIILYNNNKETLGEDNEGKTTNLLNQSILSNSSESTKSVYIRTKVKRLKGIQNEDDYSLYLSLSYNIDGQSVNDYSIITDYSNETLGLQYIGDYIFFDSKVINGAKSITNINVKAEYRNKSDSHYDSQDINMSNNTRTESWEAAYNISVDVENGKDYVADSIKGYTYPAINPNITGKINLTFNDNIYKGEQINTTVTAYLIHQDTGKKYYPEIINSVGNLTNYNKINGTAKLALSGTVSYNIDMSFKDLKLPEGGYQIWLKVKPDKYEAIETIPWNADYTKTDNISFGTLNVSKISDNSEFKSCPPTTKTTIKWNTKFQWSNRVKSRPNQIDRWYSYTDDRGNTQKYFICCSCNNQSGKNDGKTNWGPNGDKTNIYGVGDGPYYENAKVEALVWTSSTNKWNTTNNITVYTGESFKVAIKVIHKSNRDILPNALYVDEMGYDTPYSMNGIGHAWGCDYLSRWPNISYIEGPQKLYYKISGTYAYNKNELKMYNRTEIYSAVDRILYWDVLPEINVPMTNKNQTITINYATEPYWGYNIATDPLHKNIKLCDDGILKINVSPSTTVPGEDEIVDKNGTGVE